MARRNPSRSASVRRRGACGTWRISPPRPISPTTIVSESTARSSRAPSIASATARSAAGSATRTPPATLAYTSWLPSATPARCCNTATSIDSRLPSNACATRLGIGAARRHDERLHLDAQRASSLHDRGHDRSRRADAAVGEEQRARVVDRRETAGGHLHEPELVGGAESVLQRAQHAQRVMTITFERQHGVDDVLQHPRPGEPAVFGDVADEQRGDVAFLREPHELLRAVADLGDRARRARRLGIVHGLDRVDREHHGLDHRHVREHRGERGLRDDEELGRERPEPVGPHAHLGRRLLGAHQQAPGTRAPRSARAPA